jgi:DNA-binding MarR family transcriptional regulator
VTTADDIARLIASGNALARIAALKTGNRTPATQWRALSVLRCEGPRRLGELAAATRTTQPGMTRLVVQLVESGLVERRQDEQDSRVTILALTPAGAEALDDWTAQMRDALAPMFDDLDADDRAVLARAAELLASRTAPTLAVAR